MKSLSAIIEELSQRNSGVAAAALFDMDGLAIASSLNSSVDPDVVAAISAALLANGEKLVAELGQGNLNLVMFQGEDGITLLSRVQEDLVFAVLARSASRLGLLLSDVRRTGAALAEALG